MVEKVVIDTTVLIDALERGNEGLLLKLTRLEALVPYVALYEYLWGYLYLGRDYRKEKEVVEKLFVVVYPDQRILLRAMELDVQLAKQGLRIPQADLLIAATALTLGAPLLTMDAKHYERLRGFGLRVLTEL